jgi:hypothetical protein
MSPTPEASERQRKAAHKAWDTIRRNNVESPSSDAKSAAKVEAETGSPMARRRKKWSAANYPEHWRELGAEIRTRSRNAYTEEQCECRGECLKHHGRCEEINGTWAKHRRRPGKVKIRFTVAHLCHTPKCDDRSHLKAMCEPCHLLYDLRCRQRGLGGEAAVKWAVQHGQSSQSS